MKEKSGSHVTQCPLSFEPRPAFCICKNKSTDQLHGNRAAYHHLCYAPNFEKVDGAYCFWSVRGWVRAWVGHTFCTYCNF